MPAYDDDCSHSTVGKHCLRALCRLEALTLSFACSPCRAHAAHESSYHRRCPIFSSLMTGMCCGSVAGSHTGSSEQRYPAEVTPVTAPPLAGPFETRNRQMHKSRAPQDAPMQGRARWAQGPVSQLSPRGALRHPALSSTLGSASAVASQERSSVRWRLGRAQYLGLHLALACVLAGLAAGRHPGLTAWRHGSKGGLEGCILMLGATLAGLCEDTEAKFHCPCAAGAYAP